MIQSFVDKYFFLILVITLVFAILLYNTIGFDYTDELCAVLLLALFFYGVLKTPSWSFNKMFLVTLFVFFFYTVYSIRIGSNTKQAVFTDLIIQMKPYLAFFCVYQLRPGINKSRKQILKVICLIFWFVFLLPLGLYSLVDIHVFDDMMGHPAYYGIAVIIVSLCYYYCSQHTLRDRIVFLCLITIGIFSGRSKFYGFFVFSVFFMLFFHNITQIKLNLRNILIGLGMVSIALLVAWQKISYYFYDAMTGSNDVDKDMIARYVLYAVMPEILNDYFPFGSGLASFATNTSAVFYSNIYVQYGIDSVWGLSKSYPDFISDTYYPSLAQFGYAGIVLYISFWINIFIRIIKYYKRTKNIDNMIIALLILVFLTIEGTTASTFIAQGGFFVMMLLGLILSEMQLKEPGKQLNLSEVK